MPKDKDKEVEEIITTKKKEEEEPAEEKKEEVEIRQVSTITFIKFEKSKDPDKIVQLNMIAYFSVGDKRIILTLANGASMVINFFEQEDMESSLKKLGELARLMDI